MKEEIDKGCDLKLFFARKNNLWFSPWAYPHIETIVDVQIPANAPPVSITNSRRYAAAVSGGSCTKFSHERNTNFAGVGEDFFGHLMMLVFCFKVRAPARMPPNVEKTLASLSANLN